MGKFEMDGDDKVFVIFIVCLTIVACVAIIFR